MKSKEYWRKRAEKVASEQFKKTDDYVVGMHMEYLEAYNSIKKDIEAFYARFSQNNEISLAEARKLLNSSQLYEFKMSLQEFIEKAKNNIDGQWEKELNNVSYKVRITRLQALQTQIKNEIELLYSKQTKEGIELLKGIYKDTYYRNIYELHKGLGIGINFAKLDTNTIEKVFNEKWHESNYSSRIWNDKEKLVMEMKTNLMQSFIRGDSIDKTSSMLARRMEVASNRARTLINTESAYIASKATLDGYAGSGVIKQYEILATLDLRTSEICRSMDGRVFKVSEKEIGINAPPFHPNCRTTTIAYFDDALDEERIAKDHEGNTYYVDGKMKYEDWYNKHIDTKGKTINNSKLPMNLELFGIDEKKELEKLISNGVIDSDKYNECYNYFKDCFKDGVNTPIGIVYDERDRYIHIARRHPYMVSKEKINNIIDSLKYPNTIYKTKDKFGIEGNGYIKKLNGKELLTVVRNGIITSYYPSKKYIEKIKEGELLWASK